MTVLDALTRHLQDHAVELVRRAADTAVETTKQAESRRTGTMEAATTHTEPVLNDTRVVCEIRVDTDYAEFQDRGTGIYGPFGVRIFPTRAKVLRFDWPAAGGIVYARSIAGAPGRHFFAEPMPGRWADALQSSVGGAL